MRFNSIEKMCNYYEDEVYEGEKEFFESLGENKYIIFDDGVCDYLYIVRVLDNGKYYGSVGNNGEVRFLEIEDIEELEVIREIEFIRELEEERSVIEESIKENESEEDRKLLESFNRVIEYMKDCKL